MGITTSSLPVGQARANDGYVHDVMLWSRADAFVRDTVDFVRAGLLSDERVLVALPAPRLRAVRAALGEGARHVAFADMEELGSNPARIIAAWVQFVTESGDQPSRGVGEPLWAGRTSVEVNECQLHEALLNDAIPATAPLWLRCPYEVGALPTEVVDEALSSHPWVAESDGTARANESYGGGGLGRWASRRRSRNLRLPASSRTITPETLRTVRDLALHVARVCGVAEERAADLGLALHELGVNSVVHGHGGTLRLWRTPRRWSARSPTPVSWRTH